MKDIHCLDRDELESQYKILQTIQKKDREIIEDFNDTVVEALDSIDDENIGYYKTITRVANILRAMYSRYHLEGNI